MKDDIYIFTQNPLNRKQSFPNMLAYTVYGISIVFLPMKFRVVA